MKSLVLALCLLVAGCSKTTPVENHPKEPQENSNSKDPKEQKLYFIVHTAPGGSAWYTKEKPVVDKGVCTFDDGSGGKIVVSEPFTIELRTVKLPPKK